MNLEGKIVFISGAITGVDGLLPPSGLEWEAYLRITKAMVREADIVYVLQNWERSRGVKEEVELAERLGKEIIYEL